MYIQTPNLALLHLQFNINNQSNKFTFLLACAHDARGEHLVIGYLPQSVVSQFLLVAGTSERPSISNAVPL